MRLMFKNKTFLLTGASGFIGGRIIERLCRDYECQVKALVHNLNHAFRIARFKIEIASGDILDRKLLQEITKNVDYVIHCAVGNTPDVGLNHQITVEGTRNILRASLKNKVKRVIYFSTISVYGYPLPPICHEEIPHQKVTGDFYNQDKIEAEKIVQNYIKKGLPGVILQPTIVYGPYSGSWVLRPIREIKKNRLFLEDQGQGIANPVYIDNLVDAVFLALVKKRAIGETFIISDGKAVTWKKFFGVYRKMLGEKSLPQFNLSGQCRLRVLSWPLRSVLKIKRLYYLLDSWENRPSLIDKTIVPFYRKGKFIKDWSVDKNRQLFFKDRCLFKIDKAQKILGYSPRISFSQGMKLTQEWLKYARFI